LRCFQTLVNDRQASAQANGVYGALAQNSQVPTSWSPDGKTLLYFTGGGPRNELFALTVTLDSLSEAKTGVPSEVYAI